MVLLFHCIVIVNINLQRTIFINLKSIILVSNLQDDELLFYKNTTLLTRLPIYKLLKLIKNVQNKFRLH